jgi:glyoxylase-like metal-dependent hydrolase (beta-lactamase superfamily II)
VLIKDYNVLFLSPKAIPFSYVNTIATEAISSNHTGTMPRIPIEDNFADVIGKAQRGWKISDEDLAKRAEVTLGDLKAVQEGSPNIAVIRRISRHLRLSPDAMEVLTTQQFYPYAPDYKRGFAMFNTHYEGMGVNSYLIWDTRTKNAAAFDTGASCTEMLDLAQAEGLKIEYIFITHAHEDHIADLAKLHEATKAEVWISELEEIEFTGIKRFKENAHFHLGGLAIKTLLTSGHSPGQTTFYVTGLSWPLAIVGDSIFSSSVGGTRTHFDEQLRTVRGKIFSLPADTVLACGHGPLTTLNQEKANNPFFKR